MVTKFTTGQKRESGDGVEYLALLVEGDSFIYHQIRKMVRATTYPRRARI